MRLILMDYYVEIAIRPIKSSINLTFSYPQWKFFSKNLLIDLNEMVSKVKLQHEDIVKYYYLQLEEIDKVYANFEMQIIETMHESKNNLKNFICGNKRLEDVQKSKREMELLINECFVDNDKDVNRYLKQYSHIYSEFNDFQKNLDVEELPSQNQIEDIIVNLNKELFDSLELCKNKLHAITMNQCFVMPKKRRESQCIKKVIEPFEFYNKIQQISTSKLDIKQLKEDNSKDMNFFSKKFKKFMFLNDDKEIALFGSASKIEIYDVNDLGKPKILVGHSDKVTTLAKINENRLASSGKDCIIIIWDLLTGKSSKVLRSHTKKVNAVLQISPTILLSGGDDGSIIIWDLSKSEEAANIRTINLPNKAKINNMIIIDNNHLAVAALGKIYICNIDDGKFDKALPVDDPKTKHLLLADNNEVLISAGNRGCIKFWQWKTGVCYQTIVVRCNKITKMVLFDQKTMLVSSEDGYLMFIKTDGGKFLRKIENVTIEYSDLIILQNGTLVTCTTANYSPMTGVYKLCFWTN